MEEYIDLKNNIDNNKLKEVAQIIKKGGIVIFPTETVYGIGANGLDEKAIKKLYDIKQRPTNKPISLLVANIEMINEIAKDITDIEYKIMEAFFPGPLTIILNKKDKVPNIVSANQNTIGVRMPSEIIARKIIEYANVPIATPSANISGKPSGTNVETIMKDFKGKIDCVVDSGDSKIGVASTIVKVINGKVHILREGSITKEQIEKAIQ